MDLAVQHRHEDLLHLVVRLPPLPYQGSLQVRRSRVLTSRYRRPEADRNPQCRPTQDPAIDTFRLEYILGPCAVLALIFNYKLCVLRTASPCHAPSPLTVVALQHGARDPVVLLHLPRSGRDPPAAVHAQPDRRGRDDHDALLVCARSVPGAVHPQLGLPVSRRRFLLCSPWDGPQRCQDQGPEWKAPQ